MTLRVRLEKGTGKLSFSGPGTFQAKEAIKGLGQASWNAAIKSWDVIGYRGSLEELSQIFPSLEFEPESSAPDAPISLEIQPSTSQVALAGDESLSVVQLNERIRRVIARSFPGQIFVYGRLSKVNRSKGRTYLELADVDNAACYIRCVIWADEEKICRPLLDLGFCLEVDLQVKFKVSVNISSKDSSISLSVVGVVAEYTVEKLAAQRELTNRRLIAEGLFSSNKQSSLPMLPRRLGLITSSGGTVINDFCAALEVGDFGFELLWLPTQVQGQQAVSSLISAVRHLQALPGMEAILIFRGGGSPSELAVFNDYNLARAVCVCPLPVFSAIGHQQDQCSVEDVSFRSFGVPKDIGRFFADIVIELRDRFALCSERLIGSAHTLRSWWAERLLSSGAHLGFGAERLITLRQNQLSYDAALLPLYSESRLEDRHRQLASNSRLLAGRAREKAAIAQSQVDRTCDRLLVGSDYLRRDASYRFKSESRGVLRCLQDIVVTSSRALQSHKRLTSDIAAVTAKMGDSVGAVETLLLQSAPEVQLRRGFSIVRGGKDRGVLTSSKMISKGDSLEIQFSDGTVSAEAKDIGESKNGSRK